MSLTKILIDQKDLVTDLQSRLATKDSWKDLLTTATGQALIEFSAANTEEAVFANERTMQETFMDTALMPTNIRERARHLGVRLNRKTPAHCTVTLSRTATGLALTLPAYTVFTCNGLDLYNRTALTFGSAVTSMDVTLYAGVYNTLYALGTGADFQTFLSSEKDFAVSEYDVKVLVNAVNIPVVTDGFWRYSGTAAVRDQTTADGRLELLFGNAYFGTKLASGAQVQISYIVNNGLADNDVTFGGNDVRMSNSVDVWGITTTGLSGGSNESAVETYRLVSSSLFASGDRAVNKAEYQSTALNYPGVIDAQTLGQAELSPTRLSYMSLVRVALLTDSVWDNAMWLAFVEWYTQLTMYTTRYYQETVRAVNYTITAELFFDASADLNQGLADANAAATLFTTPRAGSIGSSVYKSEIYDMLKLSNVDIKYLKMAAPTVDVVTKPKPPVPTFSETAAGSWAANAVVEYQVSGTRVYDPGTGTITGETLPVSYTYTVGATASRNIVLTWPQVLGVDGIRIYKKVAGVYKRVADLAGTATTFTDNGTANTTENYPSDLDTSGVWYPVCTAITLTGSFAPDRGTGAVR
jgi:hypothetical protein